MRVVFNSDVLYSSGLLVSLPRRWEVAASACRNSSCEAVIPRTTVLELQRQQIEFLEAEREQLVSAAATLSRYGIAVNADSATSLLPLVDVEHLIRTTWANVRIEEPTLSDYEDAHRRACLHESPLTPGTKSDEMRDLVIWAMAIRFACEDGGAVLVSRDDLHSGNSGGSEAAASGLLRATDIEPLIELLDRFTPAAQAIQHYLSTSWDGIVQQGLDAAISQPLSKVRNVRLHQGVKGPTLAEAVVDIVLKDGRTVQADVLVTLQDGVSQSVELRNIRQGSKPFGPEYITVVPRSVQGNSPGATERLESLRHIIRDTK